MGNKQIQDTITSGLEGPFDGGKGLTDEQLPELPPPASNLADTSTDTRNTFPADESGFSNGLPPRRRNPLPPFLPPESVPSERPIAPPEAPNPSVPSEPSVPSVPVPSQPSVPSEPVPIPHPSRRDTAIDEVPMSSETVDIGLENPHDFRHLIVDNPLRFDFGFRSLSERASDINRTFITQI